MTDDLVQRLLIAPISCLTSEQCSEHRKLLDEAATRIEELKIKVSRLSDNLASYLAEVVQASYRIKVLEDALREIADIERYTVEPEYSATEIARQVLGISSEPISCLDC